MIGRSPAYSRKKDNETKVLAYHDQYLIVWDQNMAYCLGSKYDRSQVVTKTVTNSFGN
jgi:hypothetical protein